MVGERPFVDVLHEVCARWHVEGGAGHETAKVARRGVAHLSAELPSFAALFASIFQTAVRLMDAARFDLSSPTDPKAQHKLGEIWFAFATDARHVSTDSGRSMRWWSASMAGMTSPRTTAS